MGYFILRTTFPWSEYTLFKIITTAILVIPKLLKNFKSNLLNNFGWRKKCGVERSNGVKNIPAVTRRI